MFSDSFSPALICKCFLVKLTYRTIKLFYTNSSRKLMTTCTEPPEPIRPDSEIFQRPSLAESCQDLGSWAKTWDFSGQRNAKTWVFLCSQEPKSWVSLSRVKVDIMKILCFSSNEGNCLTKLAPNYTFLQVKFVNFTPRLRASLSRENPSLEFLCQVLESVFYLRTLIYKISPYWSKNWVFFFWIKPMYIY